METKAKLEADLKESMKSGNEVVKRTVRMALSNIKFVEKEKGTVLDESSIFAILQKEIKSRRESIQDAIKANRNDLEQMALAEIAVLETYLPKPLSDEELAAIARQTIEELRATSPADMGKVIKAMITKVEGRAANDKVSLSVRGLLQK